MTELEEQYLLEIEDLKLQLADANARNTQERAISKAYEVRIKRLKEIVIYQKDKIDFPAFHD